MAPLVKQNFEVRFTGGVNTILDPKQLPPTKLALLQNGVFTNPGKIEKRNGYATLSGSDASGGYGLATYNNSQLLLADPTGLKTYAVSAGSLTGGTQPFVQCTVTQQQVVRNTNQQWAPDGNVDLSGAGYYAWEDSAGGVYYRVVDSTGATIAGPSLLALHGIKPKVLSFLIGIILYYDTNANQLMAASFAAPTAIPAIVAITDTLGGATEALPVFDATVINTLSLGRRMYVAFYNALHTTTVYEYQTFNTPTPDATATWNYASSNAIGAFANYKNGNVVVAASNNTTVQFIELNGSGLAQVHAGTIDTVTGCLAISGASAGTGTLDYMAYYSVDSTGSPSATTYVKSCAIASGTPGPARVFARYCGLMAKPFCGTGLGSSATYFVPVAHQSPRINSTTPNQNPQQNTNFLLYDTSPGSTTLGVPVARFFAGVGGGVPDRTPAGDFNGQAALPESVAVGSNTFAWAALQTDKLTSVPLQEQGVLIVASYGVSTVSVKLADSVNGYLHAELGNGVTFGGGFPWLYDGEAVSEHGFHLYPEGLLISTSAGAGVLLAGTYGYCVVYEWTDNNGQIHRSAPSVALSTTAAASDSKTITWHNLVFTSKSNVQGVVYRTTANGSIYYKLASVANDPTLVSGGSYADTTITDAVLATQPQLYTTGGVIENVAPNPCSQIIVHQNRMWALDTLQPLVVWYSQTVTAGAPVEWSDLLTLTADAIGGNLTALGALDDKLILFKQNSILYLTGIGPDATGSGSFNTILPVTGADTGCVNPRSVVRMPEGLMFQSPKGICLLTRDLQCMFIGAEVQSYTTPSPGTTATITSALLAPGTNQVRFALTSGVVLVYDYYVGQWSVFTNINAVDAAIWQGKYCYLQNVGVVEQETPGTYVDPSSAFIQLKLTTAWIQTAGMQGFGRVYKVDLLGSYLSAHSLNVQCAYDFAASPSQTDVLTGQAPYQFRVYPNQPKCEAIQLTIYDSSSGTNGASFDISGLTFEYGRYPGAYRLPAARTAG